MSTPLSSPSSSSAIQHHHRSPSSSSSTGGTPHSPLPSQTHHSSILPHAMTMPTPALVESVAGGAHYSGGGRVHSPEIASPSPMGSPLGSPPATQSGFSISPLGGGGDLNSSTSIKKRRRSSHGDGPSRRSLSVDLKHQSLPAVVGEIEEEGPEAELNETRKILLSDLKDLYECRPNVEIFKRGWNKDATFEDPLCKARGFAEYAAQWYALGKLLSSSKQIQSRVMSSTQTPNRLVFTQTQEYKYKWFGQKKKVVKSIVILDLDQDDKIIRMVDQWEGKEMGMGWLRRVNGKVMPWLVSVPKIQS